MQDDNLTEQQTDDTIEQSGNGGVPDDVRSIMREARAMIPVTARGTTPQDFAQQVDFAQAMAKAQWSLPAHLRGNVGDCLAVIDIASRAGLSPYMVAGKTYVQKGHLCFESQLFHAFAQASGLLKGDLMVEYEGDGDDMVCVVSGYLRSDPHELRVHRSERLGDLHPGHTEKDGKTFVAGSPLWDRKPRVQLFYDTSRDWIRIYCPRATLGIYTPDEIEEYGPDFARDVTPPNASELAQRVAAGWSDNSEPRREGLHPGNVANEAAAAGSFTTSEPNAPQPPRDDQGEAEAPKGTKTSGKRQKRQAVTKPAAKRGRQAKAGAPQKVILQPTAKEQLAGKGTVSRETSRAEKIATEAESKLKQQLKDSANPPKDAKGYIAYARAWLASEKDPGQIVYRWAQERKLRHACGVFDEDRQPLEEFKNKRLQELGAR